ncbi:MAG TPA: PDZ domain-containing protein [Myxococcota bacterium]
MNAQRSAPKRGTANGSTAVRCATTGRRAAVALGLALAAALAGEARAGTPMPEGYPGRGRIGIEVQPMTAELREFFAAPAAYGVLVVRVEPGRPAAEADVQVGDVVVEAAGEPLVRPHDLVAIVARAPAGQPLVLTIVRARQTRQVEVVPEGEPASAAALEAWHEKIGARLRAPAPAPPTAPLEPVARPEGSPRIEPGREPASEPDLGPVDAPVGGPSDASGAAPAEAPGAGAPAAAGRATEAASPPAPEPAPEAAAAPATPESPPDPTLDATPDPAPDPTPAPTPSDATPE